MSDPNQMIQFVESCVPPIRPGTYTLTVKQEITELDADKKVKDPGVHKWYPPQTKTVPPQTKTVHVQGERFSIDPHDIDSVFPPEGNAGDYGNETILPHITFSRKSLPWEQKSGVPGVPWLALLVFHETDEGGLPAIVPSMVGDLSRARFCPGESHSLETDSTPTTQERDSTLTTEERDGTRVIATYADMASAKPWQKRPGENEWDPCLVADIPVKLFQQIAPTKEDLPWLAHSRIVSGSSETREYSAVIANRVPLSEGVSMACLVSLEQIAEFLPPAPIITANDHNATHLRLVVLKAWSFRCGADLQGFHHPLSTGPLKVPYSQPDAETPEDAKVKNALAMGYTALDHNTRWGDRAISWYRGPFLPFSSQLTSSVPLPPICEQGYVTGTVPLSSADEALRYDPELGMLDVSYAAAWQLGRLIALRDQTFARDLYHWKRENKRKIIEPQEAEVYTVLAEIMQAVAQSLNLAQSARDLINDPGRLKAHLEGARAPESVVSRLEKLRRLEDVPLDYLVPDERMLPPESLRFFQVDLNWIYSLVEGAYSIGRVSTDDQKQDAATCPHDVYRQISGFLLRSAIVSGWPNLQAQVEVSNPSGTYRQLRCQRITPDILLYLVEVEGQGVITSVTFQAPLENVEFQLPKSAPFRDRVRSVVDIRKYAQGEKSAAHFARKLTGVCTPSLTFNPERESLSLRFESTDKRGYFEWQFLVNDRPFLQPVGVWVLEEITQDPVELEIPLVYDLPHGEIAVRVRPTDPDQRHPHPGRWMSTTTYHRPPPGFDAQPVLRYRIGDDWITAEWPASSDLPQLEAQLFHTSPDGQSKPVGAMVTVEPSQVPATIRAVLKFGNEFNDPHGPGKVQVRFRLMAPATEETLPRAWRTSTGFLTRLQSPIYAGSDTTCTGGLLKLRFFDTPDNISMAESSTLELRLTPSPRPSKKLGHGPRKPTSPGYMARGSGHKVDFTVTPEDLPPGRYQVAAQMIGQANLLISSTVIRIHSDENPIQLLGQPRVTVNSTGTLTWSAIDDAVHYVVVASRPTGTGEAHSAIVPASPAPSLDLVAQNLTAGTYQVTVQAFGAWSISWSGPVSEPVLATIHTD